MDSAFVQAMREGWVVMIDEVNTARDVCLLSINATPRRPPRASTSRRPARRCSAQPGFAVLLAYNPGLVGATDIPDAWHSRFPATLEVSSNWAALAALGAPEALVGEAMRLDRQRIAGEDGLTWTPQFRDIEALWRMIERIGERAGAGVLCLQPARAGPGRKAPGRRGGRRVPDARPGRLRAPEGLGVGRAPEPARLPAGGDRLMAATASARRSSSPSFTARARSAAGSTRSFRTSPITGRGSCSACTRCGR